MEFPNTSEVESGQSVVFESPGRPAAASINTLGLGQRLIDAATSCVLMLRNGEVLALVRVCVVCVLCSTACQQRGFSYRGKSLHCWAIARNQTDIV